jgi:hypothetical protein
LLGRRSSQYRTDLGVTLMLNVTSITLPKRARAVLAWLSDRGWFRARLEHHIIICGFPRSGSTLVQAWLEAALPEALTFGRERAATSLFRNLWPGGASIIVSKRPDDVEDIHTIRAFYRRRPVRLSFLVMTRDPRSILVSKYGTSADYYVTVDRWRRTAAAIEAHREDPDVLVVDYADVVQQPEQVATRVEAFLGLPLAASLRDASSAVRAGFDARALNGVRPLEASRLRSWDDPKHAARLAQVMVECPELVTYLRARGYER